MFKKKILIPIETSPLFQCYILVDWHSVRTGRKLLCNPSARSTVCLAPMVTIPTKRLFYIQRSPYVLSPTSRPGQPPFATQPEVPLLQLEIFPLGHFHRSSYNPNVDLGCIRIIIVVLSSQERTNIPSDPPRHDPIDSSRWTRVTLTVTP